MTNKTILKHLLRRLLKRPKVLLIAVIILVLAAAPALYFYSKYASAQHRLSNPNEFAKEEARAIIAKVGLLMMLPKDEEPTVATVTDRTKLANQPFFANAQNGDKVLLYTRAQKAILYRPAANKIIEVSPITIGQATASAQPAAQEITFDLRNGTIVTGLTLTKKYETELKKKIPTAVVVDRDNAKRQDYASSLLIDNTTGGNPQAAEIAKALGIALGKLPAGEATSAAQFTIIVGADKQ